GGVAALPRQAATRRLRGVRARPPPAGEGPLAHGPGSPFAAPRLAPARAPPRSRPQPGHGRAGSGRGGLQPALPLAGRAAALAGPLDRAETDPAFYHALRERCAGLRGLIDPERERRSWACLLHELGSG